MMSIVPSRHAISQAKIELERWFENENDPDYLRNKNYASNYFHPSTWGLRFVRAEWNWKYFYLLSTFFSISQRLLHAFTKQFGTASAVHDCSYKLIPSHSQLFLVATQKSMKMGRIINYLGTVHIILYERVKCHFS